MSDYSYKYNSETKCPYCDYEDPDSWELHEDHDLAECGDPAVPDANVCQPARWRQPALGDHEVERLHAAEDTRGTRPRRDPDGWCLDRGTRPD